MNPLDTLLPLMVLAALGVLILILLRRNVREGAAQKPVVIVAPGAEPIMEAGDASASARALIVVPTAPVPEEKSTASPIVLPTPRRKRTPAPVQAPEPTTIEKVVDMLKEKDSLATAFLLREILAPPVSRR